MSGDRYTGDDAHQDVVVTVPDLREQPLAPEGEPLLVVHLVAAPLRVWERAGVHTSELVREFSLMAIGRQDSGVTPARYVPQRLVELAADLQARYAGISEQQVTELDDALAAGQRVRDFTYPVPASVAQACQQLQDLLDEADAYCEQGELMTLVSPPEQREFRRWYLQEFVRQISGEPPAPWRGSTD